MAKVGKIIELDNDKLDLLAPSVDAINRAQLSMMRLARILAGVDDTYQVELTRQGKVLLHPPQPIPEAGAKVE